ncbi:MAG: VIT domain-containing protein [Rhizobacter sp.]
MRTLLPGVLVAFTLLGASFGPHAQNNNQLPNPQFRPDVVPRLVVRDARIPVRLESVDMRTEVIGHAVQTRVELVFRNPNDRVLEGELQFPLHEGQLVTGFALDINGELRPAVPVEKAKGQQVFEDVIRARVDPALLEVTQGNNYKLRIYPLPPQGTRRVLLSIAQTLASNGRLELPLKFADSVPRLDVDVMVADANASALSASAPGLPPQAFTRSQQSNGWAQLSLHQADFAGSSGLVINLPVRTQPVVATQTAGGQNYFYAELPAQLRTAPRAAPKRIALLWDASGSGARRDHGREFALLDAYFRALRNVDITLRVGRDVAEPAQRFSVKDGRWDELRRVLDGLAYDGATNLPALVAPEGNDIALLFSDGLSNWGPTGVLAPSSVPLYALSAAASVDATRLRLLAERSGGEWLDLSAVTTADATRALQTRKARLLRAYSNAARQLVAESPYAVDGRLNIAGVLSDTRADVTLEFENVNGRIEREQLSVVPRGNSMQVAQRWASLRVNELSADYDDNRGEIRRLGKAFGLVTGETSLIVLDAVADYVRFEIEPPVSMRADYERLMAQQGQRAKLARASHIDRVVARFAEQVSWWDKVYPKDDMHPQQQQDKLSVNGSALGGLGRQDLAPATVAAAPAEPRAAARSAPARVLAERDMRSASKEMELAKAKSGNDAAAGPAPATIQLTPWAPDTPYARRLRSASPEAVYQRYLDERPDFVNSTAFFLDSADVLFAKGRPELALRVLSNLAEMDLENRHILRVLGYRLLQAKQAQLAIPVLRTVQRLSPNEPQSYRDLGLAQAEAGQLQDAADQLWQVVSRPWDGRFPDIDMTALAELNAVIDRAARNGQTLQTDAFDKRLLRNLPLDLRITLAWDADNTDIDLWVIDPNGEKAYYGHRFSYQGGRVSHDVTGGYGPEEYSLRVAKPGRYTVQAQFYGHRQQVVAPATTVMMRLTTGFGRADQKDELVTLRLAGQSDMVTVGSFEVGR